MSEQYCSQETVFISENLSAVYRPSPYELLAREAPESSIQ